MPRRKLDLLDARDPRAEATWRALEARSTPSYFSSWAWLSRWLAALPDDLVPSLAVVTAGGEPAVGCLLARRRERRRVVATSDVLYVNATGTPRYDVADGELVAAHGAANRLADLVSLVPGAWHELVLPAIDRDACGELGTMSGYRTRVERDEAVPFVELDAVRATSDYPGLLGASTRAQLCDARRAVRRLEVEVADDARSALDIYGELLRLEARSAHAAGRRGAFADAWFERFHRGLILSRLDRGEIQLVRVRGDGATLGCLYNFVYRGRVSFYRGGFASNDDPRARPGLSCHAAAVEHNARVGHAIYDLVGDCSYKHRLGTTARRLMWLRLDRPQSLAARLLG